MCEIRVVQICDGKENEIMRDVEKIKVDGNNITIFDILGRETTVQGSISNIDLSKNLVEVA